jgi:hypothetical protein
MRYYSCFCCFWLFLDVFGEFDFSCGVIALLIIMISIAYLKHRITWFIGKKNVVLGIPIFAK